MSKTISTGLVALLFGIIYSFQAFQLPKATVGNALAPLYFPLGLGILMAIFGFILIVQDIMKNGIVIKKTNKTAKISYTAKMITYTSVISILYALIFDKVGYVISTILFMAAILFAINGKKQWKINMIVSISFALIIYISFSKLLGIILPPIPYLEF